MNDSDGEISQSLQTVLNRHGYSFQYSLMRKFVDLRESSKSMWLPIGAEFPVDLHNETTHIDFVQINAFGRVYMIVECKRSDPAKANWCFVKTPYTWEDSDDSHIQFDKISINAIDDPRPLISYSTVHKNSPNVPVTNLGIELRTGQKGDGTGNSSRSSINDAISQVLRGSSGFINHFQQNLGKHGKFKIDKSHLSAVFLPVIFTTAQLWITDSNIGTADLATGYLPKDAVAARKVDWLWFNHNRSKNLSVQDLRFSMPDSNYMSKHYYEFVRSVAIVGPDGVEDFLRRNMDSWLGYY